jgi:hydroxymethylpyrimidine/phosphomethylpyrimidine kinase
MVQRAKAEPPVVLAIAGYDPSSGAGVTADVKTISAHGCYGVTCITALTVQSSRGVRRVENLEGRMIAEILQELMDDLEIAAVKIGMLGSAEAAKAVGAFLKHYEPPHVVLDPVLKSSSGAELVSDDGVRMLRERLLRQASVITPNIDEAAALTGLKVTNQEEMSAAALRLHQIGAHSVIITGGHLEIPTDVISLKPGEPPVVLTGPRIQTRSTHGTGCAFSTSLACQLALGKSLIESARAAKRYVESALRSAPGLGKGTGPLI